MRLLFIYGKASKQKYEYKSLANIYSAVAFIDYKQGDTHMTGSYTENSVKRKTSPATYFAKFGIILMVVVLFAFGFLINQQLIVIGSIALGCVAGYVLFPRFSAEYEYIFCDGQIDFDRINGGESRKHILRVDLDNVEVLAPETSHELDKYNNSNIKVRNFSSHDPNAKKYCIVTSDEANRVKIIFEPSEKMLELAKAKSPRKVIIE